MFAFTVWDVERQVFKMATTYLTSSQKEILDFTPS